MDQTTPDGPKFTPWQQINRAVSNYSMKKTKENLQSWGLHKGEITHHEMPNALSDKYNVFLPDLSKRRMKELEDVKSEISGQPAKRSKGRSVSGYVRNLSKPEYERFQSTWTK